MMTEVIFRAPGEGDAVGLKIRAALDQLTIFEYAVEAGEAPGGVHHHQRHVDSFYVLEGEVEFPIGGDRFQRAPAGSLLVAPPGALHGFPRAVSQAARLINIHAPGGFDRYIRQLAEIRAAGQEPTKEFFEQNDIYSET